jgi:formamidopyrimidine-DNA glycosylase
MPELPEVETSRRGIEPHVVGQEIVGVTIRERRLRWPVSEDVENHLPGQTITSVDRRAKYLLINTTGGTAILHLGMSGHVSIVDRDTPAGIHDHVDIGLASGRALRLRDPRRFGSLHWSDDPNTHWLLKDLGPEPLGDEFAGEYLWRKSRGRRVAVKQFIMNANVVVGVGNIYASESRSLQASTPGVQRGASPCRDTRRLRDLFGKYCSEQFVPAVRRSGITTAASAKPAGSSRNSTSTAGQTSPATAATDP